MRHHWFACVVVLFACQTDPGGDTSDSSTGESGGTQTGGDGDGDGDETAGDGDGAPGDGDGDTGVNECPGPLVLCPDDTCQLIADDYPCCGHGGPCDPICDTQDAMESEPGCDTPLYAWFGDGCTAICTCVGTDCGALYESVTACLMAHQPACGSMNFDTCPFETTVGPTSVSGTTREGQQTFTYGVFGQVSGDVDGRIDIHLATSVEALGNFVWKGPFGADDTTEVLNLETVEAIGTHSAFVELEVNTDPAVMGTVTITAISDTEVHGTVMVDGDGWMLSGEFAVARCQAVDTEFP